MNLHPNTRESWKGTILGVLIFPSGSYERAQLLTRACETCFRELVSLHEVDVAEAIPPMLPYHHPTQTQTYFNQGLC